MRLEEVSRIGWKRRLPLVGVLSRYRGEDLPADLVAGVTVWAVLVPQALAYATLAGVPPVFGLYASVGAMLLYAIFGTSRELNVGPEGAVAILVAAAVAPLAAGDGTRYLTLAAALSIVTGVVAVVGGVLRLGWITRFLSRPILTGYIIGSGFAIAAGQVGGLLGIDAPGIGAFLRNVDQTHPWTLAVGLVTIVVTLLTRRIGPRVPAYLIAMAAATLLAVVADLARRGVAVVGTIPAGLPAVGLPPVGIADLVPLLGPGASVALLMYADSVLTEKSLAKQGDYDIDVDQEFFALGAANVGSGLLGGFPVNGSQSRSIVNRAGGAKTQLSNLVCLTLTVLTLLFLTPVFERVPRAALSGVLLVAAAGLIDVPAVRRIRAVDRTDFWLTVVTAALVVWLGVLDGILAAVLLSLLDAAIKPYRPHTAVLGRVPETERFRDVDEVQDPGTTPGLVVYRFDGPLYFANAAVLSEEVMDLVESDPAVEEVMLSAEAIVSVDSTAHEVLHDLIDDLHGRGIRFTIARAKSGLLQVLERSGLAEEIDDLYLEVDHGVSAFLRRREPL